MAARALLALIILFWSPAAFAQVWRVTEAAGQVQVRRGDEVLPARRGAVLAPGDLVATGPSGRAVLVRERDFVVVSPRSSVRVPSSAEQAQQGGLMRMFQVTGSAQYRIERQARPHFAVGAPQLVALVKGTIFTVTVSNSGASVTVTEGRVEVATISGMAREMVVPGYTARILASDPERLQHGRSDAAAAAEPAYVPAGENRGAAEDHGASGGEPSASAPHLDYADLRPAPARAGDVAAIAVHVPGTGNGGIVPGNGNGNGNNGNGVPGGGNGGIVPGNGNGNGGVPGNGNGNNGNGVPGGGNGGIVPGLGNGNGGVPGQGGAIPPVVEAALPVVAPPVDLPAVVSDPAPQLPDLSQVAPPPPPPAIVVVDPAAQQLAQVQAPLPPPPPPSNSGPGSLNSGSGSSNSGPGSSSSGSGSSGLDSTVIAPIQTAPPIVEAPPPPPRAPQEGQQLCVLGLVCL